MCKQRFLWLVALCILSAPLRAQTVYTIPQSNQAVVCINAKTTPGVSPIIPGSTGYIPNNGQIAHTVHYKTTGTIRAFQFELDASDVDPQVDNTKWFQIGSIATQPGEGVVTADEWHPFIRCNVAQLLGGGSVTATYTANASTNGPPLGLALTSAINRVIASATQAKFSTFGITPISTPGGGGGGLIYFTYSDTSCSGSTLTVQIGPDTTHLTTWVAPTTLNNVTSTQTIVVPAAPASVVEVLYTTGCVGAATTFDATYAFSNNVASSTPSTGASSCTITVANEAATGTILNGLAKLTGAPSKAIETTFLDTSGGAVGIVTANAGKTGNATITTCGLVGCNFDGATVAGDYVQISGGPAGTCTDAGAAYPTSHEILGRVLTTNAAPGLFTIDEFPPEMRGASGGLPAPPFASVQFNSPLGSFDGSNNFIATPFGSPAPNQSVAVLLAANSNFEIDRTIDPTHNFSFFDGTDIELHSTGANGSGSAGTIQSFIFDDDWATEVLGVETITNVSLTSNVLDITCVQNPCNNGPYMRFSGLTTATFLNGAYLTLAAASGQHAYFLFTHADYASAPDTGSMARQRSSNPIPFLTTEHVDLAGGNGIGINTDVNDGTVSGQAAGSLYGALLVTEGTNGNSYGADLSNFAKSTLNYTSQGGEAAGLLVELGGYHLSGHSYSLLVDGENNVGSPIGPGFYVYQQGDTYTRGTYNLTGTTTLGTCTLSAGLSDCTPALITAGGGPPQSETINIKICTTGLADSFDWAMNSAPTCNTPQQLNSDGGTNNIGKDDIKITWGATTGHTLGATAAITVTVAKSTITQVPGGGVSVSGTVKSPVHTFTSSAGTAAIDVSTSNVQQHALTENTTCSLSNIASGQGITFIIVQNAAAAKTFTCSSTQHVIGFMTVSATLSSVNIQTCTTSNNGTDLYCTPGTVGLTGGTP